MRTLAFLTATAALALAACGDSASDTAADPAADNAAADRSANTDMAADPMMPTTAQAFADMAAASDAYEIEAGRMAQEMGASQAVKDFGAMMVEGHTKSTADLKAAAGEAEGVTVAPEMTAKQEADLEALRNAGDTFDSVYARQQVAAHEMALAMLRGYAENGDSEPLKQFAAKTAPVVEEHLTQARTLD